MPLYDVYVPRYRKTGELTKPSHGLGTLGSPIYAVDMVLEATVTASSLEQAIDAARSVGFSAPIVEQVQP